jgi:hypothetical protein
MFFFSKGIMVKGTVLRGVAVMEDKDEILFDPGLELKLLFFADWFRVGTEWFWFSWAECVLAQKQGTIIVGIKRWCFLTQKRGTGCWSKWQHEIFLIHYFALRCNECYRDVYFLSLAKGCCVTDDTGGVIAFVIVPIHQYIIGMVYWGYHLSVLFSSRYGKQNISTLVPM